MPTMTTTEAYLVLTVAHHGDQEFYKLGRIVHEVPVERLFESLPDSACPRDENGQSTHEKFCIIADFYGDGESITDDREITAELADTLLDGKLGERLREAQGRLVEFYAHEARRPKGVSCRDWHDF